MLKLTWFNNLGFRLRYRIKNQDYYLKRVGWTISIYTSSQHPLKKEWSKTITLGWFNSILDNEQKNIIGIADPFLISYGSDYFVFFELIIDNKGEIWYAKLSEDNSMPTIKPALQDSFHISFPNLFFVGKNIYMIPETGSDNSVRLYIAQDFPNDWSLKKIFLAGKHYVDTSFIIINGIYYWFLYDFDSKNAMLFYSDGIEGDWIRHPQQDNINYRNGGQIFQHNGSIYRPVQKEGGTYGSGIMLMKINTISESMYDEEIFSIDFLLRKNGYSLEGSHHISFVHNDGNWLVAIDNINRNYLKIV